MLREYFADSNSFQWDVKEKEEVVKAHAEFVGVKTIVVCF